MAQQGRTGKIEDRLLAGWKTHQQSLETDIANSHKEQRIPQISPFAAHMQIDKPVVERLLLYKKVYSERRIHAAKNAPDYSYAPQINPCSRSTSRTDLCTPRSPQPAPNPYSFKPELNQNSLKIAEKLGPFGNRTASHTKSVSSESHSFRPEINKTTSINSGRSSSPRWKQLYKLNLERRERLELLRQAFAENDVDFECTFKPKTCRPPVSLSNSCTVQRLSDWEQKRQAKISSIRNSKSDKDLEECTFKPALYSGLMSDSMITDLNSVVGRKKKNYAEIHRNKYTPEMIEWNHDKIAPLFISDINSNEYDEAIKELHDLLHIGLK